MRPNIPRYTLEGVPDARSSTHYFTTADGLTLSLLRFQREPSDDVVLLTHGLTSSSDMFIMPEHENLVRHLLAQGFGDVWCLDTRMSNRHPYNTTRRSRLDDVALYDYPPALELVRQHIGGRRLHVIAHCMGSVTFMMSLASGLVGDVTSVVSNSVSFVLRVPTWSRLKLPAAAWLEGVGGLPYLTPAWADYPRLSLGRTLARAISLAHPECDVPACHVLSFMWGSGRPALYNHENLSEVTHRRIGDLFGGVGFEYFRQVRKMVEEGTAVKLDPEDPRYARLADEPFAKAAELESPILFLQGEDNRVFADSNAVCFERLNHFAPGRHRLETLPGYGHQDVFMGKNCHRDVFPRIVGFLREQRAPRRRMAA